MLMQIKTNDSNACGKRIKTARMLAGLSRKQLEEKFYVSASTLQSWEIGRNPLNEKGAKRLVEIFSKNDLICSVEWLLYGVGTHPKTSDELKFITSSKHGIIEPVNWNDEISIQKEIETFYIVNHDAVVLLVNDDGMEPAYAIGDYVGGKKRYREKISTALGMNCIVQFNEQISLVRRLKSGSRSGLYNLFCINPDATAQEPVICDVNLIFAAPIIWHRKNDS